MRFVLFLDCPIMQNQIEKIVIVKQLQARSATGDVKDENNLFVEADKPTENALHLSYSDEHKSLLTKRMKWISGRADGNMAQIMIACRRC